MVATPMAGGQGADALTSPQEVVKWLTGLGTLLPKEALSALADQVRQQHIDGAQFAEIVASRATPALGDAVRPSDMAKLRRVWNNSYGDSLPRRAGSEAGSPVASRMGSNLATTPLAAASPYAARELPAAPFDRQAGYERLGTRQAPARSPTSATPLGARAQGGFRASSSATALGAARENFWEGGSTCSTPLQNRASASCLAAAPTGGGYGNGRPEADRRGRGGPMTAHFAPEALLQAEEQRGRGPPGAGRAARRGLSAAPQGRFEPSRRGAADDSDSEEVEVLPSSMENSPEPDGQRLDYAFGDSSASGCRDRVARPAQVPRLDLTSIHRNAGHRGETAPLANHTWMKTKGPNFHQQESLHGGGPSSQGFAWASCEDQQHIAEFYGYRDEGFIATMHGLRTDMIRPRLYVGTMADAAYLPFLKSHDIRYVVNCAVEAQKAPPPYEDLIKYMLLPLMDSVDQAQILLRHRFRTLREATKFIHNTLRGKGSVLVHCVQGLSRSAALVCAYLMEYEGLSMDRALGELKSKHPGCLTSQHWQSFLYKFNAELMRGF
eukprot:TRINITY_DN24563_c0_g1_i1.p1 TRINITY_DN24563_c0_g1~~TRINITY_DN24563_c0_g1_i1.p1  ORF type:complete len:553 (-),score=88.41 TRINITY_DN24563_c0_g1_i1:75-1733(-)